MSVADDFAQLTDRFDHGSLLVGAFAAQEQLWQAAVMRGDPGAQDMDSTQVVAWAWARLSPAEQDAEMEVLFSAFYHHTIAVRKALELAEREADGNTYLEEGDLTVIGDTLSGAMALSDVPLDDQFPGGMIPVDIKLLQRLVSEVELLAHRLRMRSAQETGR